MKIAQAAASLISPDRLQVALDALYRIARPDQLDGMARFGIVGEPAQLTSRQTVAWAKGFESWDICDQTCLNAFAQSPLAWKKMQTWAPRKEEFVRRAAFALLATLAVHDKQTSDGAFIAALPLLEAAASDVRNFVKKP